MFLVLVVLYSVVETAAKKMSSTTPDVISCSTFTQQFTHPQLDDVIRAIRKSILSVVALDHTKICHYS